MQYLEVELTLAKRQQLKEAVSFEHMKARNPDHVRRGKSMYWVDQLSPKQQDDVSQLAGNMMKQFGY